MTLKPLKNRFIFKFLDSINNKGQFDKGTTETGIILQASFDDSAKESRWVKIDTVGTECGLVETGDIVLLPALRWTAGVKFEDDKVWKSDEDQAVVVLEGKKMVPLRDTVIFKKIKDEELVSSFGIVLVKDPDNNSPRGHVVAIGPDCVDAVVGDTLYYDESNFFDTFKHDGTEYAFIQENKILALG
jgi:co-chaperonin GroES (HSP10)